METSNENNRLLDYMLRNRENILSDLEQFVKKESPSNDKRLVDSCGQFLKQLIDQYLGVCPETISETEVGDHLTFSFGSGEGQILIIGHFDTVWDEGRLSFRMEGNKAYGPGIFDMKGGVIQALWALKAIKECGIRLNKKVVFLLNSDEEIGSPHSRSLIEKEAKKSDLVLVPEPSVSKTGALKTARKGTGIFDVVSRGRSAHAGNHHEEGVNALEELARQVIDLQELTDYEKGTTVNVGMVHGGTRRNVVPDFAKAIVDLRVTTPEEADRLTSIILNLKPYAEGAILEVTGGMNRPPMVRTKKTEEMYLTAKSIAHECGFELEEALAGGGGDGNFTAALGIPTLDGLGAAGEGPHAEHEHVYIDSLPRRAALFAHLLLTYGS